MCTYAVRPTPHVFPLELIDFPANRSFDFASRSGRRLVRHCCYQIGHFRPVILELHCPDISPAGVMPRKTVKGQAFGTKAKEALAEKVHEKTVRVVWKEKDRYGRIVGDVHVGDRNINAEMVREGWVWWKACRESTNCSRLIVCPTVG